MWKLVFSNRNYISLTEKNVACLMYRISIHSGIYVFKTSRFNFFFYSRISAQFGIRNKCKERNHKLVTFRYIAMRINDYILLFRVDSGCKIVYYKLFCILADFLISIVVCKNLIVCNQNHCRNAHICKAYTVLERTKIMTYMEASCRSVACKNAVFFWIFC